MTLALFFIVSKAIATSNATTEYEDKQQDFD